MLDLDRFKRFNDAHGHQAGDRLLRQVTRTWHSQLRATDILARYGGEEFALLLPYCPPGDAVGAVNRVCAATPRGQTSSGGLAYWTEDETAGALLARADAALYEAKRTGRARVVVAQAGGSP